MPTDTEATSGFGGFANLFAQGGLVAAPVPAQEAQRNPNDLRGGTYGTLGEEFPVATGGDGYDRQMRGPRQGSPPLIPGGTSRDEQWADGASASQRLLAPAPVIDRTPIVIGGNLSLTYLASTFRNCTYGLRYQFVDVLSELFEHDPHARGVARQRVLSVAGAKLQVLPADLPDGDVDYEKSLEIADHVESMLRAIPRWSAAVYSLAWGIITGLSASEIEWSRTDMWRPKGLHTIHSRRLNYSNPTTWDLHVWDQGLVGPGMSYMGPTTGVYGLRMADFPGKFVIHAPTLSGEYPTRDGEGRYIASYMCLKRMVVRATAMDFERTIRPWVVGYYSRDEEKDTPVPASVADIARLDAATKALGLGSLNSATLPDACKIEILKAASVMDAEKFVGWLDGQMSKGLLGQDFTSSPGKTGSRSASEVAERGTLRLSSYDAQAVCDTLERDLVYWLVRLNWPGCETRLCPRLALNVNEDLSPKDLMDVVVKCATVKIGLSKKDVSERIGIKLCDKEDEDDEPIELVAPATVSPPGGDEPPPDGEPPDGGEPDEPDDKDGEDETPPADEPAQMGGPQRIERIAARKGRSDQAAE